MKRVRVKKIKPMFTALVTTMNKYEGDQLTDSGLIDGTKIAGMVKEYQTVVAKGDSVREIKVGDLVSINPNRFARSTQKAKHDEESIRNGLVQHEAVIGYEFDIIELDGVDHLMLQDRDINFIVEEYDEVEIKPAKKSKLVLPDKNPGLIM